WRSRRGWTRRPSPPRTASSRRRPERSCSSCARDGSRRSINWRRSSSRGPLSHMIFVSYSISRERSSRWRWPSQRPLPLLHPLPLLLPLLLPRGNAVARRSAFPPTVDAVAVALVVHSPAVVEEETVVSTTG